MFSLLAYRLQNDRFLISNKIARQRTYLNLSKLATTHNNSNRNRSACSLDLKNILSIRSSLTGDFHVDGRQQNSVTKLALQSMNFGTKLKFHFCGTLFSSIYFRCLSILRQKRTITSSDINFAMFCN